jgi:hypothetical protein
MTRIYLKEKKVEIPKKALKWNPNGSRKPDCAKDSWIKITQSEAKVISATVGGATVERVESYSRLTLLMFLHCFLKQVCRFHGFCYGFFKVTQNFSLFRGNSRKQMCCRRRSVVCKVVNFIWW